MVSVDLWQVGAAEGHWGRGKEGRKALNCWFQEKGSKSRHLRAGQVLQQEIQKMEQEGTQR